VEFSAYIALCKSVREFPAYVPNGDDGPAAAATSSLVNKLRSKHGAMSIMMSMELHRVGQRPN